MAKPDLYTELDKMEKFAREAETDGGSELVERINTAMSYLARAGEMVATTEYLKNKTAAEALVKFSEKKRLTPTQLRILVDGECAEAQELYRRAERLNRTLVHQLDAMRSLLSREKEERKATR